MMNTVLKSDLHTDVYLPDGKFNKRNRWDGERGGWQGDETVGGDLERRRRDAGGGKAGGGQVERRRQGGGGEAGGGEWEGRGEGGRGKTEREDPCQAQGADVDAPESQGGHHSITFNDNVWFGAGEKPINQIQIQQHGEGWKYTCEPGHVQWSPMNSNLHMQGIKVPEKKDMQEKKVLNRKWNCLNIWELFHEQQHSDATCTMQGFWKDLRAWK